jgi:hypothetical protein
LSALVRRPSSGSPHPTHGDDAAGTASKATPGEPLGGGVDLIVVTARKGKQFRGELLEPGGAAIIQFTRVMRDTTGNAGLAMAERLRGTADRIDPA